MKDNKSFLSSASLISALTSVGTPFSFPQAHRKPFGWKATTARCPCWSPRLPCSCPPLAALVLYVNRSTIIAIILLILRSFQRKGLCNSDLKAKSTTFVRNITTIRLRSQFVILIININMTDITEKTENGELVTNRDQLVVVDNIESLIKEIRGQQVMLDKDLATLYGVETRTLNQAVKRNIQRFPSDFRVQLTMEECSKSQIEEYHSFREI